MKKQVSLNTADLLADSIYLLYHFNNTALQNLANHEIKNNKTLPASFKTCFYYCY